MSKLVIEAAGPVWAKDMPADKRRTLGGALAQIEQAIEKLRGDMYAQDVAIHDLLRSDAPLTLILVSGALMSDPPVRTHTPADMHWDRDIRREPSGTVFTREFREPDSNPRCREKRRALGLTYYQDECDICGAVCRPGWRCPKLVFNPEDVSK